MDDIILTNVFDDDNMEILPPERETHAAAQMPSCECCGRHAVMDDDCCGICDDCLLP